MAPVAAHASNAMTPDAQGLLVRQYCVGCHNEKNKERTAGLELASFDPSKADERAEVAEKMIRKLRAGMMPPPGSRRPDAETMKAFVSALEDHIDARAALKPNPGRRSFQRLNRAEYARSVHELLDLDVDVNAFLPPDTISHGFDNIAEAQSFSPTLMEGFLRAAAKISSLAIGDKTASPSEATYKIPRTQSQMHHIDGTPFGTRGGLAVTHIFPADGDYTFRIMLHGVPTGELYGRNFGRGDQIEVSINGERVALVDVDPGLSETNKEGLNITTPKIHVSAGPQHVAAAFIERFEAPLDDLIAPIDYTLSDTESGSGVGITTLPHIRDFSITGPYKVTGVSDTPSRRKVFVCRPTAPEEEPQCAARIIRQLATTAYRRPLKPQEFESLMSFYDNGRKDNDFEGGIRSGLQAILASPHFLFRLEEMPPGTKPGQDYRISDLDLASRLSYFIWATSPDAELLKAATSGALRTAAGMDKQVRRMLADPRSEGLSKRFASQWLRLQDVDKIRPDALLYPSYDNELAESFKRETELFFDSIVHEDRNVLDLLTADYTFVNERVAKVYRIPNVMGHQFRRVALPDESRRGILGQGAMLMQTAVADRTSPVQRGKWIMEVLLGSPPPPPPPNVPDLSETSAISGARVLSVRERMEEHRKNPACASCHKMMDPLGLALENFDVVGAWRIKDSGANIDPTGTLYDGTPLDGPASLRKALLHHGDAFIFNFTENLMAYGLGRTVEYYDQPAIRAIVRNAGENGNRFSAFVLGIVNTPAFQMSRADPALTTEQMEGKQ